MQDFVTMNPFLDPLNIVGRIKMAGTRRELNQLRKQNALLNQALGSPTGNFGYQTGFGPISMFNPLGSYQAIDAFNKQMGKTQRENMIANIAAIEPFTDRAKRRDFERNMAAARFRTQLGTQQGLTLQGQRGAQALAQQGMQGATQALASNYQYQQMSKTGNRVTNFLTRIGNFALDPFSGGTAVPEMIEESKKNKRIPFYENFTPLGSTIDTLTLGATDLDKKGDNQLQKDVKNLVQKTKEKIFNETGTVEKPKLGDSFNQNR